MDKKTLIRNLRNLFYEGSEFRKKYTSAWLREEDYGGLYRNNMYQLHVRAEQHVSIMQEIGEVIKFLDRNARAELLRIMTVSVKNSGDFYEFDNSDIIIYSDEEEI